MVGDAQLIADTFLIEKVLKLDAAIAGNDSLVKKANLQSWLTSLSGSIISTVDGLIDRSSPGSFIKSILKILEAGTFFKINPWLGVLSVIGQTFFGISLTSLFTTLVSKLVPKLSAGKPVTPAEVNAAGASLVGKTASDDLFLDLRNLEKTGSLSKIGFNNKYAQSIDNLGGPVVPSKGTPLLYRIFGFLGPKAGKRLLVGFLVWFLKTSLLGMGLLAVGTGVSYLLKGKTDKATKNQPVQQSPTNVNKTPAARAPGSPLSHMRGSGWGTQYYKNDTTNAWIIPLGNKTPEDLLLDWTQAVYPELGGFYNEVVNLPSFKRTLRLFSQNYTPGSNKIIVPPGFNRPIDVVNQFAGDVARSLQHKNRG
jgi:hypothetical protein